MKPILIALAIALGATHPLFAQDSGSVKAGRINLYYQKTGKGAPLILIHAGYQDHHMWRQQVSAFARNYCVIMPDMPGHGLTTGTDTTIKIAEVICILLDSLHIQKASLVGLSLGSSCVWDFVLAHPDRVDKAVLVSPGLTGWRTVMELDSLSAKCFNKMDSAFGSNDKERIARDFTEVWCDGPHRPPEKVNPRVRQYVYQTTRRSLQQHTNMEWPQFQWNPGAAPRLSEIHNPVLLIYGELDVPFSIRAAQVAHTKVTGSKLIGFKGVAHMVNMETPGPFNKAVMEFLAGSQ